MNNQICARVVEEKYPGKLFCDGGCYKRGRRHDVDMSTTARTSVSRSKSKGGMSMRDRTQTRQNVE